MKSYQLSFFKPISPSFGGSTQKGKRKTARPLDPKSTIHLVLKSSKATGSWSLLHRRHKTRIQDLLEKTAKENGIKVYRFTNVGNHCHLLIKIKNRDGFKRFLRIFSSKVALLVTQAKKGEPKGKFWTELAFTRIVQWGKDFNRLTRYFLKNDLESLGFSTEFATKLVQRGMILESG